MLGGLFIVIGVNKCVRVVSNSIGIRRSLFPLAIFPMSCSDVVQMLAQFSFTIQSLFSLGAQTLISLTSFYACAALFPAFGPQTFK